MKLTITKDWNYQSECWMYHVKRDGFCVVTKYSEEQAREIFEKMKKFQPVEDTIEEYDSEK